MIRVKILTTNPLIHKPVLNYSNADASGYGVFNGEVIPTK